jgi:8-amino-7-oxononanoate synthase
LHRSASTLRNAIEGLGLPTRGFGPIVPVIFGAPAQALAAAAELRRADVHVLAIRPPTVSAGSSRIRITVTARHTDEDIQRAVEALSGVRPWLAPSS